MADYTLCSKELPRYLTIVWCIPEGGTPFRGPFLGYRVLKKGHGGKYTEVWKWCNISVNVTMAVKPEEVRGWRPLYPSQLEGGIREYID